MDSKITELQTAYAAEAIASVQTGSQKTEETQDVFAELMSQIGVTASVDYQTSGNESENTVKTASVGLSDDRNASKEPAADRIKKADNTADTDAKDTISKVQKAGEAVEDAVCEEFEVTKEELEAAMELLGLSAADLLEPANLVQLITQLTGEEDVSSLLMREDFLNVMHQVSDLTAELGMTAEELQQLIAEMPNEQETSFETVAEGLTEQPVTEQEVVTVTSEQPADEAMLHVVGQEQETPEAEAVQGTQEEPENVTAVTQKQEPEQKSASDDHSASEHSAFEQNGTQPSVTVRAAEVQPQNTSYSSNINVSEILSQIAEYVRASVTTETTSLEMQLNPENLGKLYLHLSATKEGNITAQFAAQNEAVKEALELQLVDLRQTLNQQGIKVDAIEVTVSSHEFEKNLEQNAESEKQQSEQQEQQQTRRGLNRNELDELSGLMTEEELIATKIMLDNGNSMDVMA